jgi:hypothetical protein
MDGNSEGTAKWFALNHDVLDGVIWHFHHYSGNPRVKESFSVIASGEVIEIIPGVFKWGAYCDRAERERARGTTLSLIAAAEAIEAFAQLNDELKAAALQ